MVPYLERELLYMPALPTFRPHPLEPPHRLEYLNPMVCWFCRGTDIELEYKDILYASVPHLWGD